MPKPDYRRHGLKARSQRQPKRFNELMCEEK